MNTKTDNYTQNITNNQQPMLKDVTRYVKPEVTRELWARAAGRCQFDGCNKPLYKSPVTQEQVNIAEQAHIYSFAKNGPRGWGPFVTNKASLNNISNLMLVCHDCHKTIDQDKNGTRYSAKLLMEWKRQHEQRVYIVTGISSDKKSHVVLYGANIGSEKSPLHYADCIEAMFPEWYPAEERPLELSMSCEHQDHTPGYWSAEEGNLRTAFNKYVAPRIRDNDPAHFSLFALAPQPLLILLGSLYTDKIAVEVYQPHREPKTWRWQAHPDEFGFVVKEPNDTSHPPALLISLSDKVAPERITSVLGNNVSIWEFTVEDCHNDLLRSQAQRSMFRDKMRKVMVSVKEKHGQSTPLSIFPVMPVCCALELGRIRMPKADMPWVIFDHNNKAGAFIKTITIGGNDE